MQCLENCVSLLRIITDTSLCAVNQGACTAARQALSLVQRVALFSRRSLFCKYISSEFYYLCSW